MVDNDTQNMADAFCAGSRPPQNGLEERLDMIVAQLSVIAIELRNLNERETVSLEVSKVDEKVRPC